MKFAQIVIQSPSNIPTGGEVRNVSIKESMLIISETHSIAIDTYSQPYKKGKRIARTVLFLDDETITAIVDELNLIFPTVIVLEGVGLFSLIEPIRDAFPAAKIVIDFHNIEHQLLRDIDKARIPWILRCFGSFIYRRDWSDAYQVDLSAGKLADAIWVCSDDDATIAREIGICCPIHIVPNPVPAWCGAIPVTNRGAFFNLLFIGHLGYPPNKAAVKFLHRKVFPRLKAAFPKVKIMIAGRNPGKTIKADIDRLEGVSLIANPDELFSLYSQSNCFVLPIFEGGGTRIKVLEALSVGCPIIATEKAVEGVGLIPDFHYLKAQTPDEFCQQILKLYEKPELGLTLRNNGFEHISKHYSRAAHQHAIEQGLNALL